MICRVHFCQREADAKGMCWGHYQRARRYGTPLGTPERKSPIERIMDRTSTPDVGCWLYETTEERAPRGMTEDGRVQRVALTVWEHYHGSLPEGLRFVSLCQVKHCVRPDHHVVRARKSRTVAA